jgi:outer membrane protein assembly factor BamB
MKKLICGRVIVIVGMTLLAPKAALATDQWPQFRGLTTGAVADDPALPDTWSETENVAWSVDIAGLSWSCPVVWGDHVFITTAINEGDEAKPIAGLYDPGDHQGGRKVQSSHRWMVMDLDFDTGEIRWSRELHRGVPPISRHLKNSFASETPVTDGERVYVYLGSIGLVAALSMDGEELWRKDIGAFETMGNWGSAASPTLWKDRLYVVNDNQTKSFMAVFDTATGEEVWRVDREEPGQNWATPFIWEHEQRTEIVTSGSGAVRSYDLNGEVLWQLKGTSLICTPTPFAAHGLVYIGAGYPADRLRPLYAIRAGASGDISLWPDGKLTGSARFPGDRATSDSIAWAYPLLGTYGTTPVVYGNYLYTLLDRGFLLCHDARTGEEIYGRQRVRARKGYTASPWAYNGKVFLLGEEGETYVIQAGPEFKILHTNSLNEMTLATPAIARGSLFIRTQSRLYRITQKGTS